MKSSAWTRYDTHTHACTHMHRHTDIETDRQTDRHQPLSNGVHVVVSPRVQGATTSEIKKQYHLLSKKFHPDKGGDEAAFMMIAKAYAAYVSASLTSPPSGDGAHKSIYNVLDFTLLDCTHWG